MNLSFKLKPFILKNGSTFINPTVIFDEHPKEKEILFQFLEEMDNDFTEKEFFYDLDHWEEMAKNKHWNTDSWSLEKNVDNTVTLSDIHEGEDDLEPDELYSPVTLTVKELKGLLIEYRKRAKEFREDLRKSGQI